MNLSRSKRIIILVLIILNIVLLALRIADKPDYTISSDREKAIYEVLGKNNIALYTDIISSYEPMQQILVSSTEANIEKILPAFFDSTENMEMTIEFSKTIYSDKYKMLTLGENTLLFEDYTPTDELSDYSYNQASNAASNFCEVIMAALNFSKNVELEKNHFKNGEYTFRYVESYNKSKLFCNFIDITVKNGKILRAEASRYGVDGFTGNKQNIAAPDEIMLTFLYELKKSDLSYGIIITDMEIGYDFQSTDDIASGDSLSLVPCYRIYIQGTDEPFTINAYTNELISL
ncbi:MAG: hypothetical protein IJF29_04665 [Firmicutes bacterium]|nr:hypothetical protein [Bacillota bacterium]